MRARRSAGNGKPPRREIFVLTPGEKRAVVFTLAAFMLGLGTMYYRSKHPPAPVPLTQKQLRDAKREERRLQRRRGETTPRPRPKQASPRRKQPLAPAEE
jgi:hypothetical protein